MKLRQALLIAALTVLAQSKPHESKKSHSVKHSREHELTNRMGHGDHHRRDHGSSSSLSSSHKEGSTTQKAPHDKVTEHSSHSHKTSSGHELKKEQHQHQHHITEHNIEKKKDDDKPGMKHLVTNKVPEILTGTSRFGEAMVASAIMVPKQSKKPMQPMAIKETAPPPHVLSNRTPLVPQMQPKPLDKLILRNTTFIKMGENNTKDPSVLMESEHLIHVTSRPVKTHRTKGNHHKNKSNNQTTQKPSNKGSSLSTGKIQKTPKKYSAKKHGWKKSTRKDKTAKERLREKYERREKRAKALHHAIAGKKN